MLKRLLVVTGCVLGLAVAQAAPYPERAVRTINPFAPGGATDILARQMAKTVTGIRANFGFHRSLFATCGNPYLAAAIEDFRNKTHVVWSYAIVRPGYFRNAQREHHAMLKAIRKGDRKQLLDLCGLHLNISRHAYVETQQSRQER